MIKRILRKAISKQPTTNQEGFTLVEAVIAIMLLGIIAAALYMGLGSASKVLLHTDVRETAKNLAETQMEYVKAQSFSMAYSTTSMPTGYIASINVIDGADNTVFGPNPPQQRNSSMQKVIVTITAPAGVTYTLEGYRVR